MPRVIPLLLLRNGGLYKTIRFRSPQYLGDPINAVRIFNEKEVDELILLDIDATREKRGPILDMLSEIVTEAFMPVCYGGGISDLETFRRVFEVGIEKVAVNSVIRAHPEVVAEATGKFGSQSVVGAIDASVTRLLGSKRSWWHAERAYGDDPIAVARQAVEDLGVGELLLTAVDREGTGTGLDLELIRRVAAAIEVPVIAHGGVGSLEHVRQGLASGAGAVACGSFFVFRGMKRAVLISYLTPEERASLVLA